MTSVTTITLAPFLFETTSTVATVPDVEINGTLPDIESEPGESGTDNIIASVIIFIVGVLGLTANVSAIWIIRKVPSLRSCFGNLLLLHAVAEACVMIIFICWAAPISIFNHELSYTLVGKKLGHLILFWYFICLYSQLAKALNRLLAIANPMLYRSYFSDTNSKFVVGSVILIAALHSIVYFFDGCNFYFDGASYVWTFDGTPCGGFIATVIDFMYGCALMGTIIFIDFCTFLCIHRGRKLAKNNASRSKEIRFFIQACLTSILYAVMLMSFHLVWRFYSDPWIVFASTTLAWELCHALDGVLMIAFNSKLRKKAGAVSINPSRISKISSTGNMIRQIRVA